MKTSYKFKKAAFRIVGGAIMTLGGAYATVPYLQDLQVVDTHNKALAQTVTARNALSEAFMTRTLEGASKAELKTIQVSYKEQRAKELTLTAKIEEVMPSGVAEQFAIVTIFGALGGIVMTGVGLCNGVAATVTSLRERNRRKSVVKTKI